MTPNRAVPKKFGGNTFLDFEKPLARIEQQIEQLEKEGRKAGRDSSAETRKLRTDLVSQMRKTYSKLSAWQTVLVARHPDRPHAADYIDMIGKDFCELHGDRLFMDDKAILTGFVRLAGHRALVVAHRKGKEIKEKVSCYFGCAHPEGYRKALLKMKLAEKFGLPIICLIDTPGAYPGVGAEERGIAQAIAVNLQQMSTLRTPIICVVISEGGSGGALGIGVGDRVAVMEYAYYSVISPEGCAAILWKTNEQAQAAAEALKLTGRQLKKLALIDQIIPEPLGAAHRNPQGAAANLEKYLARVLKQLKSKPIDMLLAERYQKLRNLGSFFADAAEVTAAVEKPAETAGRKPRTTGKLRARKTIFPKRTTVKI